MTRLEVVALPSDREVESGDDLAPLILRACEEAGVALADGDVLCVAQKVVSKAEGAVVPAPPGDDPHAIRRQVAREQAVRLVADTPWVLVVETSHGLVCANAGVDASNLPDGTLALLPEDPDGSAARLREALESATGARLGVLVTDTFGRPWRLGQTDVAIGASGVAVIRDERGDVDRFGHELEVTEAAVADELAGAADLVRRKADGTPFVLVRGAGALGDGTARGLVRPSDEDVFRVGGPIATAVVAMVGGAMGEPASPEKVGELSAHALASLPPHAQRHVRLTLHPLGDREIALALEVDRDDVLVDAGAAMATARIAANTMGLVTSWDRDWRPEPSRGQGSWQTLGLLRVARPG